MSKTHFMTSPDTTIYIDPAGADRDRREINSAIESLEEALALLKPDSIDTSLFQGNAYEQTRDRFGEICKRLENQRQICINMREDITRIVNHYIALDREIQKRVSEVISGGI